LLLSAKIKQLEKEGDHEHTCGLLKKLAEWQVNPRKPFPIQTNPASTSDDDHPIEVFDLTDDIPVVDVDTYIIEVLLVKVIKSEPNVDEESPIPQQKHQTKLVAVKTEPDAKKGIVAKAVPPQKAKTAPPNEAKAAGSNSAPPDAKEADDKNEEETRNDYFRGARTGAKICSLEPPLWSSELNGTWNIAYVESVPNHDGHYMPEAFQLSFGPNGTYGSIRTKSVDVPYDYLLGELSMGALCEQQFLHPTEQRLCWSYGWKPEDKGIDWLNDYLIGPNGDADGDADGHLELIIGGPLRSDYNPEVEIVDRLPANCLWAQLHIEDSYIQESRYDRLLLCRPSDLSRVQQLLAKGISEHFGYDQSDFAFDKN
jgi:hypothetical protein